MITIAETYSVSSKNYGAGGHEISFSRLNVSEAEVDRIADALIASNVFLENRGKWYAYVRREGGAYEIYLSINSESIGDKETQKFYKEARGYVQNYFPNNPIIFNLVDGDYSDVKKRIE